jgi:hypothetical protein
MIPYIIIVDYIFPSLKIWSQNIPLLKVLMVLNFGNKPSVSPYTFIKGIKAEKKQYKHILLNYIIIK